ncbi:MAG: AlkA N-terminal domain-containing protein [Mycobacteriales bacterium]
MEPDFERCWRVVQSKDSRFDGYFITAVTTTGIYCRPSCPALPKRANVRFYPTAAAAQAAGYRACKRCRPDATPGSPEWNVRADLVGRAMRLIADGVVDRDGVDGLARRLGYTPRHVHRQLTVELGAGPQALARAQRAQTARVLLETTTLPISEVAFAAGFASLRQFNETVREVFAITPGGLRGSARAPSLEVAGTLVLRLPYRPPYDLARLVRFLAVRSAPGLEEPVPGGYRRSLALPHGSGVVEVSPGEGHVRCAIRLDDLRDLAAALQRTRRMLDADADAAAIGEALGGDPLLGPLVAAAPGLRVPGHVDGAELAIRAVAGQQVSVAAARTIVATLVGRYGKPLTTTWGGVTHLFPSPEVLAGLDPAELPMPGGRGRALRQLAEDLADGRLVLDPGADRAEAARRLLGVRGVGPWTADYVALRALGDPDVFLPTDLAVRRALGRHGAPSSPPAVTALAERWRPWRSYALVHLWESLEVPAPSVAAGLPREGPTREVGQ